MTQEEILLKRYLVERIALFYTTDVVSFSDHCLHLFDINNLSEENYIKLMRLELSDEVNRTFELVKFEREYKNIPCIKYTFIPENEAFGGKKYHTESALMDGGKDLNKLLTLKQIHYLYSINVALPYYDADFDIYFTVEQLVEKGVYKFLN